MELPFHAVRNSVAVRVLELCVGPDDLLVAVRQAVTVRVHAAQRGRAARVLPAAVWKRKTQHVEGCSTGGKIHFHPVAVAVAVGIRVVGVRPESHFLSVGEAVTV